MFCVCVCVSVYLSRWDKLMIGWSGATMALLVQVCFISQKAELRYFQWIRPAPLTSGSADSLPFNALISTDWREAAWIITPAESFVE